jgi:trans-aconitate 2-methyltransferase
MPWDPERYLRFQEERLAPFEDLRALIHVREGLAVVDLGCGTGEITSRLAAALPRSEVLGVDTSQQMLGRAAWLARPGLRFELGSIEAIEGAWDLVFSNAALHWLEDHAALVPRLLQKVRPGGQLVVQIPSNHEHPAHAAILELAGEAPFHDALGGWTRRSPVLDLGSYAELLHAAGAVEIVALEKVYAHVLPSSAAIVEWTSGSTLVPYFERLPRVLHEAFLERYRARLAQLYPGAPVFYGFRRILLAATRV